MLMRNPGPAKAHNLRKLNIGCIKKKQQKQKNIPRKCKELLEVRGEVGKKKEKRKKKLVPFFVNMHLSSV